MADKKPNIIVFFSDQQRWDTVGCYGQKLNVTPNIDLMASEGVCFENAFTCQPVCGPARACVQSGMYATRTGCYRNGIALPLHTKTLAHYLSEVGYDVGYVGKWHLATTDDKCDYKTKAVPSERRGGYNQWWKAADVLEFTSHGYDGYVYGIDGQRIDFEGYRADCITDFALEYIESRSPEKPFFLFLSHIEPHHQNDLKRCEGPIGSKEKFKHYEVPGDLEGAEGNWRENYPDYLGCCNSLDYNLGRIRNKLKELNIENNTVVIYTSDHGCHFQTRNGEYKRSCHESSIRIPFIACGPGFEGGIRTNSLISLIDLPATILRCAGREIPECFDGYPLQDVISGRIERDEVFLQISERQVGRCIRTKKWKYSVYAPDKNGWDDITSDEYTEQFLYDLENDPHEKNNLVSEPSLHEVRFFLAQRLKKAIVESGEKEPIIHPADK